MHEVHKRESSAKRGEYTQKLTGAVLKHRSLFLCGGALGIMSGNNVEWHDGYPVKPGWYHCRVEGGEIELYCKKCELTGKYHWVYKDGSYITERVEWSNEIRRA